MDTQQAKKSLEDIEARHADILNLEKSIKELHDMFMDMAILVESQGELVDRIEYNVNKAVDFIDDAKQETTKAVNYQTSARKKKLIIIGICVAVLLILALVIGLSVGL